MLYLGTRDYQGSYYHLLKMPSDFDNLYDIVIRKGIYSKKPILFPPEKKKNEIELVHKVLKPVKLVMENDKIDIELFTWEEHNGFIDFWHFRITASSMELLKNELKFKAVGPYKVIMLE